MNYREKMREYLKEPDEHSSQYGKWCILNIEQRKLINRLLDEMDNADVMIRKQYEENQQLKEQIKSYDAHLNRFFKINNKSYDGKIILDKLKQRDEVIDEAIEYVKKMYIPLDYIVEKEELLEILQKYKGDN